MSYVRQMPLNLIARALGLEGSLLKWPFFWFIADFREKPEGPFSYAAAALRLLGKDRLQAASHKVSRNLRWCRAVEGSVGGCLQVSLGDCGCLLAGRAPAKALMLPALQEPIVLPNSCECFDDSSGFSRTSEMNLFLSILTGGEGGGCSVADE
ncbi:MAG: hypothetical protein KBT87_02265 [Gammaproteobacteria bacterium]|nr:hypothetical protein [Gammaproteobacteria bacterium]MBQ0773475.1 hypothetical protein [Gammaproteobacteria bacterium]